MLPLALICLGAGYGFRQVGVSKKYCFPDSWFQFHAMWHILTALPLLWIYLFFRSETYFVAELSNDLINTQFNKVAPISIL